MAINLVSFLFAAFFLLFSYPLSASTARFVESDLVITFSGKKVVHDCIEGVGGVPNPGAGNCGYYQSLALDGTFEGMIQLTGIFGTHDEKHYWYAGASTTSHAAPTCRFGSTSCLIGEYYSESESRITDSYISLTPSLSYCCYAGGYFEFSLSSGLGFHSWIDDDEPYYGEGQFTFSNVTVSGLPAPAPVPVPASSLLLGSAFAACQLVKRRPKVRHGATGPDTCQFTPRSRGLTSRGLTSDAAETSSQSA